MRGGVKNFLLGPTAGEKERDATKRHHTNCVSRKRHWHELPRALHRVRQPYVQGELAGFSNCAAENQKGDESCARAKHGKTCAFKTTAPAIIEEQCATAIVEPEHPEKKSHVADARGNECLLCSGRSVRSLDPESDEQIRSEPDKFPEDKKQEQTVGNDNAEHCAGEER